MRAVVRSYIHSRHAHSQPRNELLHLPGAVRHFGGQGGQGGFFDPAALVPMQVFQIFHRDCLLAPARALAYPLSADLGRCVDVHDGGQGGGGGLELCQEAPVEVQLEGVDRALLREHLGEHPGVCVQTALSQEDQVAQLAQHALVVDRLLYVLVPGEQRAGLEGVGPPLAVSVKDLQNALPLLVLYLRPRVHRLVDEDPLGMALAQAVQQRRLACADVALDRHQNGVQRAHHAGAHVHVQP
mmetsp:Transcript_28661/g.63622  ORF Transcript_28661/g.63622 Transcript_28661/m.63622 type:complete len:241 (-) Transcript_28661:246-968(-)